jgi:hypothetical protein
MAAVKKGEASEPKPDFVVAVPFAYGVRKDGEVRQLVKGDAVIADEYDKDSLEHLESIGFLGKPE